MLHTYIHTYIRTQIHTAYVYTYIHTYIQIIYIDTYIHIHTYIHAYMHTYIYTYKQTNIKHTYIDTYMHTYIHTYIRTYVRTYVHTYIQMRSSCLQRDVWNSLYHACSTRFSTTYVGSHSSIHTNFAMHPWLESISSFPLTLCPLLLTLLLEGSETFWSRLNCTNMWTVAR